MSFLHNKKGFKIPQDDETCLFKYYWYFDKTCYDIVQKNDKEIDYEQVQIDLISLKKQLFKEKKELEKKLKQKIKDIAAVDYGIDFAHNANWQQIHGEPFGKNI